LAPATITKLDLLPNNLKANLDKSDSSNDLEYSLSN